MTGLGMSAGLYAWTLGEAAYYTPGQTTFVGSLVTWSSYVGVALALGATNRVKLYGGFPSWVFRLGNSHMLGMLTVLYVFVICSTSMLYTLLEGLQAGQDIARSR